LAPRGARGLFERRQPPQLLVLRDRGLKHAHARAWLCADAVQQVKSRDVV